ncbi:MAG: hypothetical protein IAE77_03250 [Prosthecobacter sp.]|jgi:hypothetical protein|uniref:hypothetical protein n=1 Tax=Prosthecobacter sp. TaxID=1965333 RepID=UPI0019DD25E8|nr:hypothetical protein [Prosthecobacter sp.]MBE2282462.1 hypothetical protein [Prosthecobacter sp.]
MKSTYLRSFILLTALLLAATPGTQAKTPPKVLNCVFGLFTEEKDGINFTPATEVPLIPGQLFGWVMKVETETDIETFPVIEKQVLPEAPNEWPDPQEQDITISEDGKSCVRRFMAEPDEEGVIMSVWVVAEGDPEGVGHFHLQVAENEGIHLLFALVDGSKAPPKNANESGSYVPPQLTSQHAAFLALAKQSCSYLAELEMALQFTQMRIKAAEKDGDEADLAKSRQHLQTLKGEHENVKAASILLQSATKEVEQAIQRRKAVRKSAAETDSPASTEPPKKKPAVAPPARSPNSAPRDRGSQQMQACFSEKISAFA